MDTDARDDERWMLLAGPAFLVMVVVALAVAGSSLAEDASAKEAVTHYADKKSAMLASVFLTGPAVALLLIWAARMRTAFGGTGGAGRKLFQYGAVLYAAGLLLGSVFQLGAASAADDGAEGVTQTMNYLIADSWIPPTIGMALLLLGAGLAVLRNGVLPRWMGMVALVAGVISLLGPGGFLGFFIGPLWVAVAGVMLYLRRPVAATA